MRKTESQKKKQEILRYILTIALTGLIVFLISHFFYQLVIVSGSSMEPTYKSGTILLSEKYALKDKLKTDNVVVIRSKRIKSYIIKRIAGCPGDTLQIKSGILYLNNKPSSLSVSLPKIKNSGMLAKAIIIPENMYFVIGDNINNSIDSRFDEIGLIGAEEIKGIIIP